MNVIAVRRIFFFILTMLIVESAAFAMGRMPGDCSKKLFGSDSMRQSDSRAKAFRKLSKSVVAENNLHLQETINLITSDQSLSEHAAAYLDPFIVVGRQAEALRSKMSTQEWAQLIMLWAQFLDAKGETHQFTWAENLCGPGDYLEAFENAPKLLSIVPAHLFDEPKASIGFLAWGTIGFSADVVTVIPNNIALYGSKIHHEYLENAADRALDRFSAAVARAARVK